MITVLEAVDDLITESIAHSVIQIMKAAGNSMFERYAHASPHTIKEFFHSFFSNSHQKKIWDEIIEKKISNLIDDIKCLNDNNFKAIRHLLATFENIDAIYDNIDNNLKERLQDLIHILNGNTAKVLDYARYKEFFDAPRASASEIVDAINRLYISQDEFIKLIFLKHFGFNNIKHYIDDNFMVEIKTFYNTLVDIIQTNGNSHTIIEKIKDYLIDPAIIKRSFSEIESIKGILWHFLFEGALIKAAWEMFEKLHHSNTQIPQAELPSDVMVQPDSTNHYVMPLIAAASAASGFGAYKLLKKHRNDLVRFQNFI